jgi:Arc/MetJ family transcription regulator
MEAGMRTTIDVRESVMSQLLALAKARTKTEAVNRALEEYVRLKRIEELRSLRGKLKLAPDIDKAREWENDE